MKKFLVVDGNALVHRAFHALPPLTTKSGELVNALYGFIMIMFKVLKDVRPDYVALTFDKAKKTFRNDLSAEYKATRVKQPDELYTQLNLIKNFVKTLQVPIYEELGFEADDLIGTLVKESHKKNANLQTIILTGDMDTLQLVDDKTVVYTPKKGVSDLFVYTPKEVMERFGLNPEQLIDYKALRGDVSDNIPGVKGIGEKTAIDLIKEFGSLASVYKYVESGKPNDKIRPKILQLLQDQKEQAWLSQKLATIVCDVPGVELNLEQCSFGKFKLKDIYDFLTQYEFKTLLSKIPAPIEGMQGQLSLTNSNLPDENVSENHEYKLVNDEKSWQEFLVKLKKQKIFALDTETTSLDPINAKLLGISFCWQAREAYYVVIPDHDEWLESLKPILEDAEILKVGHNLKYDYKILRMTGINTKGLFFDTMVASYLINSSTRQHNLDNLAFVEFGHEMIPITALIGKGKTEINMSAVAVEKVAEYSGEDADYTWRLYERFEPELKVKNLAALFSKIEMPLISVLAEMELTGVLVDENKLKTMEKIVVAEMETLDTKIFELAGKKFNIDSPLQLKTVLFEDLKISQRGLKHGKKGISTAADELEKIFDAHEIIPLIIRHRELAKLMSTYIEALPELVNKKTGRVHTSFNQTVAATGRLSSSEPNLQNIPVRTEIGRKVREAFIAAPGYKILAADYSQIELRVVASLANDTYMEQIFRDKADIHAATAAKIHGKEIKDITKEERYAAKAVNFGVLYGQGPRALASGTGIAFEEARDFIDRYFASFPAVFNFIEETKALAHKLGYVETLLGRRRYIPDINSTVPYIRAAAERMAVNTPVQGTAADLIKLAMIAINKKIAAYGDKVRMLIQVHDELVFEVKKGLEKEIGNLVEEEMVNVYKLRVPITVDVEVGDNWGELE